MVKKLLILPAAGALLIVALAACGGDDSSGSSAATTPALGSTVAPPGVGTSSDVNDADVAFAQGMIPHHDQALEMAQMAISTTANPKVLDLATRIKDAQDPEIAKMRGWLEAWGKQEMDPVMGDMGHGVTGMMTDPQMKSLQQATGTEFDTMFLQMMIDHHKGAVTMAQTELAQGQNAQARTLAQQIVTTQKAEIAEMQGLAIQLG